MDGARKKQNYPAELKVPDRIDDPKALNEFELSGIKRG